MQLTELIRFCESRGWRIRKYFDSGISGAKEHRPRLDELWADARRREIDVITSQPPKRAATGEEPNPNACTGPG